MNDLNSVGFTDRAAARARELIVAQAAAEANGLLLRVYIEGGGCSGFQYGFELDAEVDDDDLVVENSGVKLVVDPMSFQYLVGAEIDYKEDLMGAQFIVTNPNASTTCGCGMSFSI